MTNSSLKHQNVSSEIQKTQSSKPSVSFPDFTIIKSPTAPTWNPNYFKPHHMNREAEKFIKHTLMQ